MSRLAVIVSLLFVVSLIPRGAVAQDRPSGVPDDAQEAKVTGYTDGEKLKVEIDGDEETVRLLGVDAPEPENEDGFPECYAEEATARLEEMLPEGRTVYLERDEDDKDSKRRLLRYVWFVGRSDGKAHMANELMLREGYGGFEPREDNARHDERFREAEEEAKEEQAGLWTDCGDLHVAILPLGHRDNPAPVGTTLNVEGQDITVSNPFFTYEYGFQTPKGGYVFLVVDVYFENVDAANKDHDYGEERFAAVDLDTGADFDNVTNLTDSSIGSGDLGTGEYVLGQVVLEVQETSQRLRVKYDANLSGESEVYWVVTR